MFICNALPSAAGLDTGLPGAQVSSLPGAACPESQETSPWCCLKVLLTHRWFPWGRHFWDAGHTEACGHTHTHTHTRARTPTHTYTHSYVNTHAPTYKEQRTLQIYI